MALGCQGSVEDRLAEARSLQELGAIEESEAEIREVLAEHPDHPEANYLLGVAQLRLGQPTLAVWPLQIARRDPALAVDAGLALGGAYLQLDQTQVALETADQVLAAQPENLEDRIAAIRLRVAAGLREKEYEQALVDADRLAELTPDDVQVLALRASALLGADRREEARETLLEIWNNASAEEAEAGARAGIGLVRLYADDLEDDQAAEQQLSEVLERYPSDRSVLRVAFDYYTGKDQPERAREVILGALEAAPLDLDLRAWIADRLAEQGRVDQGEALLVEAAELEGTAAAWLRLSDFRREHQRMAGALEAMERTVELASPPSDVLLFRFADLLASNGELERAEALAGDLSDSVYDEMLRGRLAFERGDYEAALDLLDEALRRWPNNVGARYLAGQAAYALGDTERALAEFYEAMRIDVAATDAGLDVARLRLALGDPGAAAKAAARTWNALRGGEDPREVTALRLLARAQVASGDLENARKTLTTLAAEPDGRLPAAIELAAVVAEQRGPQAAADRLEATDVDLTRPEHLEGLRALGQYLVEAGHPEEALARVRPALAAHPDEPDLHDVKGRILFNAGRLDEARTAFQRAVELDPDSAPALEGLARVARAEGDLERALELLDRALEAAPENAGIAYAAAQLAFQRGDVQAAERRLRQTLRVDPRHPEASNDLAWILAERGEELDRALGLARQAAQQRRSANVLDTLGWVQIRRGESEDAVETLEEARELDPDSPSIAYRLSRALVEVGETQRARELLREALASGGFPEHDRAEEELARLTAADS